ncbi:MAG: AraC family transcriptional regulator [Fulvivirga sp.]|uniref:AraC family transcriptional regulator n=1 Tax=Fulvivirga sp. TaxID=1931237 RepID=UPI0032EB1219
MSNTRSQKDYIKRMNEVFQFIENHLESELSLELIASKAAFSPYHFHRIFKHISGEPLNEYINRKRIEKSAAMLIHKRELGITEIALQNGFTSNSSFTRAFKQYYDLSPTQFRLQYPHKFSKIGQETPNYDQYLSAMKHLKTWTEMNAKIEVKELTSFDVAYISCIGPQNLEATFGKLFQWAAPKGLIQNADSKPIIIYHDSFKITDYDKVRISAGITLNEPIEVSGEVGLTTIESGKFISGMYEISFQEFEKAWTGLFLWMNEKGYEKADVNPYEIHHNNFNDHPEKKSIVELFIPIK